MVNEPHQQRLIIVRGNSGSGKSTVSWRVRNTLGRRVMFLQQDVLRREVLKVEDKEGNPVIGLIEVMVDYGIKMGYDIIIEGIFAENKYGDVLRKIASRFDKKFVYYFDVSFEETLKRHNQRNKNNEFGEEEMRAWWREKDVLNLPDEQIITEDMSEEDIFARIINDIKIQ